MTQLVSAAPAVRLGSSVIFPAAVSEVWIDFDGTITRADVLDELLKQFAVDDRWLMVEQRWQAGEIGSRECLSRQLESVRITPAQLDQFLASIPIDSGLNDLMRLLKRFEVPVTVLSDGIDRFIRHLLTAAGHGHVRFRSNGIDYVENAMTLRCPFSSETCRSAAAHCKCESMTALTIGRSSAIYIGDGRSDLCPARQADVRFAKGVLAKNLAGEGFSFIGFDTLNDVAECLRSAWDV